MKEVLRLLLVILHLFWNLPFMLVCLIIDVWEFKSGSVFIKYMEEISFTFYEILNNEK